MKNTLKHSFLLALLLSLGYSGFAQGPVNNTNANIDGSTNAISTAVPFLRIAPDARSGSMGDVGVALSPDANATYWNQSKLPFAENDLGFSLSYTPWMTEMADHVFLGYLSGYKKLDDLQAVSASFRYFNLGDIQFRDINGHDNGSFHPKEFAFDIGYSRKLSANWSLGMALRYIHSNLASGQSQGGSTYKAGHAVAGDISAFYTKKNAEGNQWNFGAAITNIGSKISYTDDGQYKYFIPTNLGIGGAYILQLNATNQLTFSIDLNKLLVPTPPALDTSNSSYMKDYYGQSVVGGIFKSFGDAPGGFSEEMKEFIYSLGVEYGYDDLFALRAGYFHESKEKGNRQYFTVGFGLKYEQLGLDFSYLIPSGSGITRNPLSKTLRLSLSFHLDK